MVRSKSSPRGTGNCSPVGPRALRQEMGVFGCSSIRGVCNADIGCGAKTLRCAGVRECHPTQPRGSFVVVVGGGGCIPRAPGGPVDLDRYALRVGSRVDQLKRNVRAGVGEQPLALAE